MAFYEAGNVEIRRDLSAAVDAPCLVLLRELEDKLMISVSNPANEKATIHVDLTGRLHGDAVNEPDDEARLQFVFELPDGMQAGSSVTQTLPRP